MIKFVKNISAISIVIIFILCISMGCSIVKSEVNKVKISEQQALEIANKEAVRLGYNIQEMQIHLDKNNTLWNEYVSNGQFLESNPHINIKLKNKDFWAVYYGTKEIQFGGDIFIFIDKNTGEIIFSLPGK